MEQPGQPERSFWERKGTILEAILDEVYPLSEDMPADVFERVEIDRQMFVMRSGLTQLSPDELEAKWLEGHDTLPYPDTSPAAS